MELVTTSNVDESDDDDEDRPAGPWALGQTSLGAVTAGSAAAAAFGPLGLLIGLLAGGGAVAGVVAMRRKQKTQQQKNRSAPGAQSQRRSSAPGSRSRSGGLGSRKGSGRSGAPTGKKQRGSGDAGGRKSRSSGLSPTGRKSRNGRGTGSKAASSPTGRGGRKAGSRSADRPGGNGGRGGGLFRSRNRSGAGKGRANRRSGSLNGQPSKRSRMGWLRPGARKSDTKNHKKPDKQGKGKGQVKPGSLTPPPNPKLLNRRPANAAARPEDTSKTPPTAGAGGDQKTRTNSRKGNSMGRIRDVAEEFSEAVKTHPLDKARDMEAFLDELAEAKEIIAKAESHAGARSQEEFPADSAVGEALGEQSRKSLSDAAAMRGFKSIFRKRHQQDYERFEAPRTEEHKMDYRAQLD